jgi:phosphoribosylformylglycinamidine synthase
MGASICLASNLRPEFALFHEGPSRVLISTASPERVGEIAKSHDIACLTIGATMKERLQIANQDLPDSWEPWQPMGEQTTWIDCPVERLREVWEKALEDLLAPAYV